jgi:hypothetical protein
VGWSQAFDDPIALPDRRILHTLGDACATSEAAFNALARR